MMLLEDHTDRIVTKPALYSKDRSCSDDLALEKMTIRNGSLIIFECYDNKEYARRMSTIMESLDTKQELGEMILWGHLINKGLIRKRTREMWIITNYRVMYVSYDKDEAIQLPLKYIDVVVMNTRSDYYGEGMGAFAAVPGGITAGMGYLRRRGTGRRIGDLVFILAGQILITFSNVIDPVGVKQLIYQVKKQMYGNSK